MRSSWLSRRQKSFLKTRCWVQFSTPIKRCKRSSRQLTSWLKKPVSHAGIGQRQRLTRHCEHRLKKPQVLIWVRHTASLRKPRDTSVLVRSKMLSSRRLPLKMVLLRMTSRTNSSRLKSALSASVFWRVSRVSMAVMVVRFVRLLAKLMCCQTRTVHHCSRVARLRRLVL